MSIHTHHHASHASESGKKSSVRGRLIRRATLIAFGAVGSIALSGCGRGNANPSTTPPRVVRAIEVDTTRHGAGDTTHYTGAVRARFESTLGFRVAGKVAERLVDAGDTVKRGQPLLRLDPTDYRLALQAAQAVREQASLELERVRVLVDEGAESRDTLERATAAAESRAALAEQTANQASYTTLCAEADGVVMTTLAEPGQVVAAGQPVVVLALAGAREAAVDIPESLLERIRQGEATARLYVDQTVTVPATLREVSGVADAVSRTYQARYVLGGDPARFPLGATVTVQVSPRHELAQSLAEIPLGSLIDRGDGAAVWVVDPDTSTIQKRAVSIARLGAESALIGRGLHQGDLVVSLGAHLLNTGEVVRLEKRSAKEAR